jgi:dTDP-4-dehydrorhamnose reductase
MMSILANERLQLWGGIECTVNRVQDTYRDQLLENGHDKRDDDLDRFADLHLDAIRYPVLWERTAPNGPSAADWRWPDRRLNRLRELGISPIAGLLHHGSGPPDTSLLGANFVSGLADFASAVAARYPWIEAYTPVNEPLTTARFSALYGHWYPHARDDDAFARALVNQCAGTAAAMRAIRRVNSSAKLVLTEDLGKTHSTPLLAEQAHLENQRRWLSVDLLTGRVNRQHPLWQYLARTSELADDLLRLADEPCPPDILGFNYYLTSERFLDERLERYPAWSHGGNGKYCYADVEAVRVSSEGIDGPETLLTEAWQRFGLPMAMTEVHLGGYREEQVRWLLDDWDIAQQLREHGVDVRAVAVWSLLGSFDWNSLCTQNNGCYESGVFDVRGNQPRPTAIARVVQQLGKRVPVDTVSIPDVGWWRTDARLAYPPVETGVTSAIEFAYRLQPAPPKRPLLILGARGTLGRGFVKACKARRLPHVALSREQLEIGSATGIDAVIAQHRPWAIVNAAGYSNVDKAQLNPQACRLTNCEAVAVLAERCAAAGVPLLTFSSDYVFDGSQQHPYLESDATNPLSELGSSHCAAEACVAGTHPDALVVRTSMLFTPWDERNFLILALRRLAAGASVVSVEDRIASPTYVPDLAHACLDLLVDAETGIWHLANRGETSWADFIRQSAIQAKLPCEEIERMSGPTLALRAPRPAYSALGSERGQLLPPLADAIRRFCREASNLLHRHDLSGPLAPV